MTYKTKVTIAEYPPPSKELLEELRQTPSADALRNSKLKYKVKAGTDGVLNCPCCEAELIVGATS